MNEQDRRLVFTSRIPIRWSDMDAMGHVNNTVYFRYMEQARIEWYASFRSREKAGMETVVVNAHCTYFRPLKYPGDIEVRTYAGSPGRSSFEITQDIVMADDPDTIYASGGAKVVWIDLQTVRSVPLPEELRTLITPEVA
ncbi:MAG: putative esterase [Burkholderiaceae bacterium]|nr:putative esterase [Burkholderiaceae bacterium]